MSTGYVEFGFDSNSHVVPTPGPKRASDPRQKLVVQFAGYLNSYDAEPERIAADLCMQPVEVQRNLARFVNGLLATWAEMGEYTSPNHPLANEYANARKMVQNLFR